MLFLYASNEVIRGTANHVIEGAKALGWETVECDGQGNPAKIAACAESLLVQNVDVLYAFSIEPGMIRKQLTDAKNRSIKTLNILLAVSAPEAYDFTVVFDDHILSKYLCGYLSQKLSKVNGEKTIALQTFPQAVTGIEREEGLKEGFKTMNVKIVDEHRSDNARIAEDTRRATEAVLTAYPKLNVLIPIVNFGFPHAAQVVHTRYPGKDFPERPLVVGYVDDPINLDTLRKGLGDAVASHTYRALGWFGLDQLAQYYGRKKPFDRHMLSKLNKLYGVKIVESMLITKENVPPPPAVRWPEPVDYPAFFKAKWTAEFNVVHGK